MLPELLAAFIIAVAAVGGFATYAAACAHLPRREW